MRYLNYISGVMLTALLGSACVPTQSVAVSEKEDAQDSLNSRNYDRAIAILEQLHRRDGQDAEVSILLASAYGGSVGLNVIDSFSAFGPLLFDEGSEKTKDSGTLNLADDTKLLPKSDKMLRFFTKFFESVGNGAALYFNMPYAKKDSRPRLVSALLLVQGVPNEDPFYDKAKALSVLLSVAQFLNYLRDAFPGFQVDHPKKLNISSLACSISPLLLAENLKSSAEYASQSIEAWREVTRVRGLPFKPNMETSLKLSQQIIEYLNDREGAAVVADVISNRLRQQFCD